jgi:hypothetical protein
VIFFDNGQSNRPIFDEHFNRAVRVKAVDQLFHGGILRSVKFDYGDSTRF